MILDHMRTQYAKTQWPYFGLNTLIILFGPGTREALNEIHKNGIIKKREGLNQTLIEYHG